MSERKQFEAAMRLFYRACGAWSDVRFGRQHAQAGEIDLDKVKLAGLAEAAARTAITELFNEHARSGQAASGSSQGARSDEHVRRLQDAIEGECDGLAIDEHHARAILEYVLGGVGQPEAPTAAPLTDEQATAFLLELRAVVAETMKRPGEAVPIPARVRTEVAKFMRDQPSVFDRLPYGEVVALAEFCGGVVAHPPARSGADFSTSDPCPSCRGVGSIGEPPIQCPFCRLHKLGQEAARSGAGSEEAQPDRSEES